MALHELAVRTGASSTRISFGAPNPVTASRVTIEAGAADLEVVGLGNARAERIDFQDGVGETLLDFSGAADNITAKVQMGIGSLTLRLPRSHGVRIDRDAFLASFDDEGLSREGDSFVSANWDGATRRIDLDIDAALGSVEIDWID